MALSTIMYWVVGTTQQRTDGTYVLSEVIDAAA